MTDEEFMEGLALGPIGIHCGRGGCPWVHIHRKQRARLIALAREALRSRAVVKAAHTEHAIECRECSWHRAALDAPEAR